MSPRAQDIFAQYNPWCSSLQSQVKRSVSVETLVQLGKDSTEQPLHSQGQDVLFVTADH